MPDGSDPIDRLHAANPHRAADVPDASLARVTARIQEHLMSDKPFDPTVRPSRGPLVWVGGLAVVGVIALAFAFGSGALGTGGAVARADRREPDPDRSADADDEPRGVRRPGAIGEPGGRRRHGLLPRLRPGQPAHLRCRSSTAP